MKSKYSLLVAMLIFVAGAATYFQSVKGRSAHTQSAEKHYNKPFVITFSRYNKSTPAKSQTIVQLVNSQGKSLLRRISRDGRDIEHIVHQYDHGFWKNWSNREDYLQSTQVIQTEQFLGITAYVSRQDIGGQIIEAWYAPETGPVALKQILETPDADTLVTEATNLEFREVSDAELEPQPSLIVNYPN